MARLIVALPLLFVSVIFFGSLFFLANQKKKSEPLVLCTTTIIADAVAAICNENVEIKILMGPGVDPHLYRARESDVTALSSADLIFYNGLHLEGKMGAIFSHMQSYVPTVAVGETVAVSDRIASDFEAIYDPHIWHDVSLFKQTIPAILAALVQLDPAHEKAYQERADNYMRELDQLHAYVHEQIAAIPVSQRILVTAHDAFAYFGRAYGITVVGLQGISTDAQVSVKDIHDAVTTITTHQVPAIFLESSIPSQSVCAVQRAVNAQGHNVVIAPELFSDSLGDKSTTAHTYCGMIKHNVDVIVSALIS